MQPFAGDTEKLREAAIGPIRKRLAYAGYRHESAVITYMGSRVALAMVLPVFVLATPASWSLAHLQLVTALLVAAGFGLTAPSYWLDRQVKAASEGAPAGTARCPRPDGRMRGGGPRDQREPETGRRRLPDDPPDDGLRFELANFETRAGKSTTEALRGLADRTGVSEVNSLVAMLIQTERFGTGLADTLRVHADGMRLRRLQRAEEQANLAPLKMLFPTAVHLRRDADHYRRSGIPRIRPSSVRPVRLGCRLGG